MKILAIIPARKNSKGVPGKNGFRLGGKTLVELAVECARESGVCTDICISSDDAKLRDHPDAYAIPRPPWLATDEATTEGVVQHALCYMWDDKGREYDAVMVLQPTSPLRTAGHLVACVDLLNGAWMKRTSFAPEVGEYSSVVSLTEIDCPPSKACYASESHVEIPRNDAARQSHRQAYKRDGVCYLVRVEHAANGDIYGEYPRPYYTPPPCGISIDTEEDWEAVQRIWSERNEGK